MGIICMADKKATKQTMSNSDKDEALELNLNATETRPEVKGLSFFTADDNDTSSESDSDVETSTIEKDDGSNGTIESDNKNNLPSPRTLFATVGKPKFLDRLLEDEDIDWNTLSKRYEPLFEYSSVSCPAETVDLSSVERTEASISGAPVKYKKEISETKQHLFLHGKRSVDMSNTTDATAAVAGDVETSSKKQKAS